MGIIRLYYPTGEIKYCGYKRGEKSKNIEDQDDIFLHLLEDTFCKKFDKNGNLLDVGIVRNGRIQYNMNKTIWISLKDEYYFYEGNTLDNIPYGRGILKDQEDNTIYVGNWSNGLFHGYGILYCFGEIIYKGEFHNGQIHGKGELFNTNLYNSTLHGESSIKNRKKKISCKIFTGLFHKGLPYFGKFNKNKKKKFFKDFSGIFYYITKDFLIYSGQIIKGKRNGYGSLFEFNEEIPYYSGEFKKNKITGKGMLQTENFFYEGQFVNGLKDGFGKLVINKSDTNDYGEEIVGTKYIGYFKNDEKDGDGVFFEINNNLENIKRYSGSWKKNQKNGKGAYFYGDCLLYEGYFLNDKYDGKGIAYFNNGNVMYSGDFKNNNYHGKGASFYPNQKLLFNGIFNCSSFVEGSFYDRNNIEHHYEGNWNGQIIEYNSEQIPIYEGSSYKGQYHGYGMIIRNDYSILYQGMFQNNKFHGDGVLQLSNGKMVQGQFIDNLYVKKNRETENVKMLDINVDDDTVDIVYEGTLKDNKYFTGVEFGDYETAHWQGGKILTEKDKRQKKIESTISLFLETKNRKILKSMKKVDLMDYFEKKEIKVSKKKNTNQLLNHLMKIKENKEQIMEDNEFDLFGNEIVKPCLGDDGNTYDESSMIYLFEKDENNEYINIEYTYEGFEPMPNFPIMTNGKKLTSYVLLCETNDN